MSERETMDWMRGRIVELIEQRDAAAEAMREACAGWLEGEARRRAAATDYDYSCRVFATMAAERIRALPVPADALQRVREEGFDAALAWAANAVCEGCGRGLEYRNGWHYTDEMLAARQQGGSPCEAEAIRARRGGTRSARVRQGGEG